jgi:beta-ribofuranosylaminobenzene 5'-phosphate synthase
VFVEAPARLHFGVLDLRGGLGRWFGGIGAPAPTPPTLVSACRAERLSVSGQDADRAKRFAGRVLEHYGVESAVRLQVHRSAPAHVGLGSGTKLALAVARALAAVHDLPTDVVELARAVGRADRSAIGTYAFAGGGLVVEGGRRSRTRGIAPLLARLPFPTDWWCVVGVPGRARGLNGSAERDAFAALPPPPERDAERVSHLVLMALLPALADADLKTFGEALTTIQSITGEWFASVQGGTFAPGPSQELVRSMSEWGASGVGQSSWGPTVYGIVEGEDAGRRLAGRVRAMLGASGSVYAGPFPRTGARLWRSSLEAYRDPIKASGRARSLPLTL